MPIETGKDSKGCYARWGKSGKKYYYECGNDTARDTAKAKADKQGQAIKATGWKENNNFVRLVANLTGNVRFDTMAGRDYIVAPMVMLVEGVHAGNNGPVYYPADEVEKDAQVWNHKPIVLYHPSMGGKAISACDPEILTNRQVGVIMNATGEGGKLKGEAWLEPDRIKLIDERINTAIENNQMMELSTGLWTDCDNIPGEWNGEAYLGTVTNYRPDHLALLPDIKGACSIDDGAGFLRLNEMSYENRRKTIAGRLNDEQWVEDIYEEFFIYEQDGNFYKQSYTIADNQIDFTGDPEKVVRVTEYRTPNGEFVGNYSRKEHIMNKEKLVKELIANESTKWTEDDKETLMAMEEDTLKKLQPDAKEKNTKDTQNKEPEKKDQKPENKPVENKEQKANQQKEPEKKQIENEKPEEKKEMTLDEYINNAPKEVQQVLRNGLNSYQAEKKRLVNIITANEKNEFTEDQLNDKDVDELRILAKLARDDSKDSPDNNYSGQGDPMGDSNQKPLGLPTMNFQSK